jgi:phytoene dehydrogenase-like protein
MPRTATVVGSGPNGLAAAVVLARAGVRVRLIEAADTVGGGSRTRELTLPGFRHDICSSIHPLGAGSPFFRSLPLAEHGLRWVHPEIPLAHPFDDGTAATVRRSLGETAALLGADEQVYGRVMGPVAENWDRLSRDILGPIARIPRSPLLLLRFGWYARRSAGGLARGMFRTAKARALFMGIAAHANGRLDRAFTASFAIVLGGAGHAVGWPAAAGGSQSIADAMTGYFRSLGGEVVTGCPVESLAQLDETSPVLFDLTPRQVMSIAGGRLSDRYRKSLRRFRYGPGVFKLDYALDGPIPWTAEECRRAGTVHLGATMREIEASEEQVAQGKDPETPYIIVTQPSVFDATRAPEGKHTAWAYCHVPSGSTRDMTDRIEAQIERFAPGFRDAVLARHATGPAELEEYNANYIGGDIAGGAHDGLQLFFRPALRASPYRTSDPRLFICSASTPPGAGVHGMCGYHAAQAVLSSF